MDRIKKLRGLDRATFTRALNAFNLEAAKPDPDKIAIRGHVDKLENAYNKIQILDSQLMDAMLDENVEEDVMQAEQLAIEKYSDDWYQTNAMYKEKFKSNGSDGGESAF